MSVAVLTEVLRRSQSRLAARLVLVALADSASNDGVTWIGQAEIAKLARISEKEVGRSLGDLVALEEIEVRKAQRGRRRINVYRVCVGRIAEVEVEYDRLPFELSAEFTTGQIVGSSTDDDRTSGPLTTGHLVPSLARGGVSRDLDPSSLTEDLGTTASAVVPADRQKTRTSGADVAVPERRRNLVYDALAEACDIRPQLLDPASPIHDKDLARELGVAQAAIRQKAQGLPDQDLAEEVALRCRAYRERWPDIDITPSAVAKHWNRVVSEAPSRGVTASRAHAIATAAEQHYRKEQP